MDIERTLSESGVSAALDVHDFKVLRAMRRRLVAEAGLVCPMADAGSALLATLVARAERTVMRVGVLPAGVQRGPRDAMFCSACAHAVLGLACSAPRALVHERFRQLVRSVHPDVCRSPAAEPLTRILVAAHETLKDLVPTADRATAAPTEAAGPRETFRAPWWYASLRNAPRPSCDPAVVDWFLAQAGRAHTRDGMHVRILARCRVDIVHDVSREPSRRTAYKPRRRLRLRAPLARPAHAAARQVRPFPDGHRRGPGSALIVRQAGML